MHICIRICIHVFVYEALNEIPQFIHTKFTRNSPLARSVLKDVFFVRLISRTRKYLDGQTMEISWFVWISALGLHIIGIYLKREYRFDRGGNAPPTFLCGWGRGGTEVGPRWDRPTHVFVWVGPRWDRGGTEVGPSHPRFCVGGTEVGPRWDRGGTAPPTFYWVGPSHPVWDLFKEGIQV